MLQTNNVEAKTDLPQLSHLLETRTEDFITIARNGRSVATITPIDKTPVSNRIGIAKGSFTIKGDFDADNDTIADLMTGDAL